MPRGKYKKRKYKYKKRRSTSQGLTTMLGLPKARFQRIRWCDNISLNTVAGAIDYKYVECNGLNLPLSGSHVPAAHAQLMTMYNHYVVLGSKCTVTWSNATDESSAEIPLQCGVFVDDDAVIAQSTYQSLVENGRGSHTILGSGNINQYGKPAITTALFSAKKFFNRVDVKDSAAHLGAPCTGNPSEGAKFAIWLQSMTTSGVQTATANVCIDYLVSYNEPKTLGT